MDWPVLRSDQIIGSNSTVLPLQGWCPMHSSRSVCYRSIVPENGQHYAARLFLASSTRTFLVARPKTCPASKLSFGYPVGRIAAGYAYGISTIAQNGLTSARMHWEVRILSSNLY